MKPNLNNTNTNTHTNTTTSNTKPKNLKPINVSFPYKNIQLKAESTIINLTIPSSYPQSIIKQTANLNKTLLRKREHLKYIPHTTNNSIISNPINKEDLFKGKRMLYNQSDLVKKIEILKEEHENIVNQLKKEENLLKSQVEDYKSKYFSMLKKENMYKDQIFNYEKYIKYINYHSNHKDNRLNLKNEDLLKENIRLNGIILNYNLNKDKDKDKDKDKSRNIGHSINHNHSLQVNTFKGQNNPSPKLNPLSLSIYKKYIIKSIKIRSTSNSINSTTVNKDNNKK